MCTDFCNDLSTGHSVLIFFGCLLFCCLFCYCGTFCDDDPNLPIGEGIILNERGKRAKENIRNAIFGLFSNDNLPTPTTDDSREDVSPRDVVPTYPSPVHSNYNVTNHSLLMRYRRNNRQFNVNLTDVHPSIENNNSREGVSPRDVVATYPSPLRSSNYNVRNNTLPPLSLSLEDRIELYNKAFNSNGNQLILKNKHIVSKINANDSESDIEVCLDIGLDTNKDEDSSETTTKMMTNGTCSICLDEFIEHDQIVYSELCSHVYHKHCMVRYLATNAQREIHGSPTLDITDNPCPSCRQPNYCQIRDEVLNIVLDTTQ